MNHDTHDPLDRLERRLREAHRTRPVRELGQDWAQGVMRAVRADASGASLLWAVPMVWRAAAVGMVVALLSLGSWVLYQQRQPAPIMAAWLDEFDAGAPLEK